MDGKMNINYDEEGDYLEIFVECQSPTYGEDVGEDITIFKKEGSEDVVGVGILNFRERSKNLKDIKLNLPFNINFSALKI